MAGAGHTQGQTRGAAGLSGGAAGGWRPDSFTLKIIAILGMTADHFGNAFYSQLPLLGRCLLFLPGGLTFPIMAFLLTIGYQYTRDVRKYALRLGIFALISLVPFIWVLDAKLNVLFTLLLGLLVIWADDRMQNRALFWALVAAAVVATYWCDWSLIGVPMILLYHRLRHNRFWQVVYPIALVWIYGLANLLGAASVLGFGAGLWLGNLPDLLYIFVGASATIPLLYYYNGQRGRPLKYFFYAYYPLHITVIGILLGLLTGLWLPSWLG